MPKKEPKQINVRAFDERFYQSGDIYMPSVTYMLGCSFPTGYGLIQWVGDVGNKRAEEIKNEAGEDGSFVHDAIDRIIKGEKVSVEEIESKFKPQRALKIMKCLKGFLEFWEKYKPEVLSTEYILWDEKLVLAGTADLKCKLNIDDYKDIWIIDWKTSRSIHPTHKVQLSLYKEMDKQATNCALVHLGNTTKAGWSFLPLKEEDNKKYLEQGLLANKMFKAMYPNAKPSDDVFPEYFSI
jgi:hypothetical protein